MSNVRRLIEEEEYSAVLIESNELKFHELEANYRNNDKVKLLHRFVGFRLEDGLDRMLAPLGLPADFDFLSIDIDGNDYHVWKAIKSYRPKLICIEFNPTIPTEIAFVQSADPKLNQGCSLVSLCRLAKEKGYELICVLAFNAFFVDSQYFPLFEISDNSPEVLRKDLSFITWLFCGYDGSIHIAGSNKLPWHRLGIEETDLQVLPRCIRSYPGGYSHVQKLLFKIFKEWRKWRSHVQKNHQKEPAKT